MNSYFDSKFQKKIVTIYPGEYYASSDDELISTVLGSCIAVAFFDPTKCLGGMNHFMLAYENSCENDASSLRRIGQYGEYSMELIINSMLKKGSLKKDLTAKVFGGGNVLAMTHTTAVNNVVRNNIDFAFAYLNRESIPIISSDVGGTNARKIVYNPKTSKILLKRIKPTATEKLIIQKKEQSYIQQVKKQEANSGDIILF